MTTKWPKIVLFGDSQVQRALDPENGIWGAALGNRFQRVSDVITRGFSGYTSRSGRRVFHEIFNQENVSDVAALVIFFGTNDASGKDEDCPAHVPVEEYIDNLKYMIDYLETIGVQKEKIILVTLGPYNEEPFKKWLEETKRVVPGRKFEDIAEYVQACVDFAGKQNIDVVNIYEEIMKNENWTRFLFDGLHLSKDGSLLLYNLLLPLLEKRLDVSTLLLPYWRNLNHLPLKEAGDSVM